MEINVVSFYTPNYAVYASQLRLQCERLNQPHIILPRSYPDWITAVRVKPQFLLEMLNELKSDFVWLDVDSYLLRKIDFTLDEWGVMLRQDNTPHDFVHYIKKDSHTFLQLWIDTIEQNQKGSHTAFVEIARNYTVLPSGYFQIGIADNESKRRYFDI